MCSWALGWVGVGGWSILPCPWTSVGSDLALLLSLGALLESYASLEPVRGFCSCGEDSD